jgi:7-carboxy-7-deazaguanine synthase
LSGPRPAPEEIKAMLKVSKKPNGLPEIFYSIQGEGANIGRPAVFLRLGLCNLHCSWCDTKYTWDWSSFKPEEQLLDVPWEEAAQEILKYGRNYLVITGGEPLMQQEQLLPLCDNLKSRGFDIEFETNGTIIPDRRLLDLVYHWSVSPKLSNSGNDISVCESAACYRFFNSLSSSHFKYVVRYESDFSEVQALAGRYGIAAEKIILMPEATGRQELLKKSRWVAELCQTSGYRFSTRLHILLWGNKRGK